MLWLGSFSNVNKRFIQIIQKWRSHIMRENGARLPEGGGYR